MTDRRNKNNILNLTVRLLCEYSIFAANNNGEQGNHVRQITNANFRL